jgi:hypothetical protein
MPQPRVTQIQVGTIVQVDPRQIWPREEKDFTPWVAEHIGELAQAVGVDIEVKEIEKRVGLYELDIYAVDKDNPETIVIIENQLNETDHKHLGQLLAYAAGLDAKVIIWIAPKIRDEHRKTVEWLNQMSDGSATFYLVRVEAIKIDVSLPAVRFEVVVAPSDFEREFENIKPKLPSIPPEKLIWSDSINAPIIVASWREVFRKVLERAVQETFDLQQLPFRSDSNADSFRGSIQLSVAGQEVFVEGHGSASELRRRAASTLKAMGKPSKFLRIECKNGSIFELP